ncbi:hypothetical protein ACFUNF_23045 [Streptomyces sp. NPDC057291]|uniref:hypothetical protein n=1 Tax=Streptomyces sp. NPDC057291 TaxID=3346087 RepID=UPI003629A5C8
MYVKISTGHQVTYQGAVFSSGQVLRHVPADVAQDWVAQGIATAYDPPRTAERTFDAEYERIGRWDR